MIQQIDIELGGVRIRGEVSAPEGITIMLKESRNKAHIVAVPLRPHYPEPKSRKENWLRP